MIQRKQTIFLLLSILLLGLSFFTDGDQYFLAILPMLMNLVAIFLYKRRPLQMRFCTISTSLQIIVVLIVLIFDVWYYAFVPLLTALLTYLAYRRIDDDEAIIQSLNRLR